MRKAILIPAFTALVTVFCSNNDSLDPDVRGLILARQLKGDASIGRVIPKPTDTISHLGKLLFFSKALGGDKDSACVTCHHPMLGGGDNLPLSIGVGAHQPDLLGPGRSHPGGKFTVPRTAPTTFNIVLYDSFLFDDGRVESIGKTPLKNGDDGMGIRTPESFTNIADPQATSNLVQAQALFPVTSSQEMKGSTFESTINNPIVNNPLVRNHLAARLGNYGAGTSELTINSWLIEFQKAFSSLGQDAQTLITYKNIAIALSEYQRSQLFINNSWKRYIEGDNNAISVTAKQGALLFYKEVGSGGGGCFNCHQGDFFTDEKFHVLAVPQVGEGKADGPDGTDDFGRFKVTFKESDKYAFRTPSLLNIEMTSPYGHTGVFSSLEAIIKHHSNVKRSVETFSYTSLDPAIDTSHAVKNTAKALAKLEANRAAGLPSISDTNLSDNEIRQLVEFLKTLTDPCLKDRACMSPWLISSEDIDPDGLRVIAVDKNGTSL